MRTFFTSFLLLFVFHATSAATTFTTDCKNFPTPLKGGYCIHTPMHSTNRDVLFQFHGLGGNEKNWGTPTQLTGQILQEWADRKLAPPRVVSISLGPVWLLAQKNDSPNSGLFELVMQKLLPMIEAELGGVHGRRLLVGESMGGFNATQLALKTNHFKKAAIVCAPMSQLSPWSNEQEIQNFIEGSTAWPYYKDDPNGPAQIYTRVQRSIELSRAFFPTPEAWATGNPLSLAANLKPSLHHAKIYLTAGMYDPYVLYEGNLQFKSLLQNAGWKVDWHPLWGGHCSADIRSLAAFLIQ